MRKFLVTALLILSLLQISIPSFAQFSDVSTEFYADSVSRLYEMGIISGNGDGTFLPENAITRAEFSVIAVKTIGLYEAGGSTVFSDVPESFWGAGFISAASQNGLIYGFPDGTFLPNKKITYAESITILLRILGYDGKSIPKGYPDGFIDKARELGILDGLSFDKNSPIKRGEVAYIFDKAMRTDLNGKTSNLMSLNDFSLSDEEVVLSVGADDESIMQDEVLTSEGIYKSTCDRLSVGSKVKLVLNKDKEAVSFYPSGNDTLKSGVIEKIAGNTVSLKTDNSKESISFDDSTLVYFKGAKSTYSAVLGSVEIGMSLTASFTNGKLNFAVLGEKKLLGPVMLTSSSDVKSLWGVGEKTTIIKDGENSSLSKILAYDSAYYDQKADTLYVYSDKQSGIFEEAYPTKAEATSVKISGKVYQIKTESAQNSFSNALNINDFVTVALGKNDEIVGVIPNGNAESYGVLLSCEKKAVDGSAKYLATFLGSNKKVQEFEILKDIGGSRGKVFKFASSGGAVSPELQNSEVGALGSVDALRFSENVCIVDVAYKPSNEDDPDAEAFFVEESDIPVTTLSKGDVVFSHSKNGKIDFLVLSDITKLNAKFGIVTACDKQKTGSTYTFDIDGVESTYTTNGILRADVGVPCEIGVFGGRLKTLTELTKISVNGSFKEISKNEISFTSASYKLSKNCKFYIVDANYNYRLVAFDDIDFEKYTITGIYKAANDEQIRVIKLS